MLDVLKNSILSGQIGQNGTVLEFLPGFIHAIRSHRTIDSGKVILKSSRWNYSKMIKFLLK